MTESISIVVIYTLMGLMVVTGSINTIATKMQQKMVSLGIIYEHHQWFITSCMFLGEITALFGYCIVKYREKKVKPYVLLDNTSESNNADKINIDSSSAQSSPNSSEQVEEVLPPAKSWFFLISAMCDFCASTLMTFGLTYLASSVYQMFRGIELLFIMLSSWFFLKSKIYSHNILGIVVVILGLALVGLNSILFKGSASNDPVLGMILVVTAQFFSAAQYVVQERIMKKYSAHPFQLVGFEGLWGSLVYIVVLTIFQFIRCDTWPQTLKEGVCIPNDYGEFRVEDTIFAFRQMGANWVLLIWVLLYIVSIAVFNYVGINVTKYVSSTARAVVDTVRTVFVWLFFMVIPWVPETSKETFGWLQFVGFILLIAGTLIYNEIVELPFWGLNKNTRNGLKEQERLQKEAGAANKIPT